jgi:hypothetical protein
MSLLKETAMFSKKETAGKESSGIFDFAASLTNRNKQ